MEYILLTTYLSVSFTWIFGYAVFIPLGFFAYGIWMQFWSYYGLYQLLLEGRDALQYINGPLRRFIVGSLIFTISAFIMWIPGFNLVLGPLFGWLALLDYYDYKYELPF